MRRPLSIFATGLAAIAAQLLLVRELMLSSMGDELSIGLSLFAWLIWAGAGSALGAAATKKLKRIDVATGGMLAIQGLLCPISIVWARVLWNMSRRSYGELVPLADSLLMAVAAMGPAAIVSGALFSLLCGAEGHESGESAAGSVYSWDSLGAAVGGAVLSVVVIPHVSSFSSALIFGAAAAMTSVLWFRAPIHKSAMCFFATVFVFGFIMSGKIERATKIAVWGKNFYDSADSGYGNVAALKESGQFSLYYSGRLAGAMPDRVSGEYLADIPLLAHPAPRKALLAGGGAETAVEMLKHGIVEITIAELDPEMLRMKQRLGDPRDRLVYSDRRARVYTGDPRRLIESTRDRFDAIIIDAGAPDTLVGNRYYTREFLAAAKKALAPGGLLAITIPYTENYTGADRLAMLGSIVKTFPDSTNGRLLPVPGMKTFLLWSPSRPVDISGDEAATRFKKRKIKSSHFNAELARYYFDKTRIDQSLSQFSDNIMEYMESENKTGAALSWLRDRPGARVNTDMRPVCVYYSARSLSGYYKSGGVKALDVFRSAAESARRNKSALLVLGAILLAAGFAGGPAALAASSISIASAGFCGMLMSIVVLLEFQSVFGVMYQYMGLIMAIFLAGSAAGSAGNQAVLGRSSAGRHLRPAAPFLFAAVPVANLLWINAGAPGGASAFAAFAFAVGAGPGWMYSESVATSHSGSRGARSAGLMYASDLAGAAAAAMIAGAFLIPLRGIPGALDVATIAALAAAAGSIGLIIRSVFTAGSA